mmetsp:Transcript_25954/g.34770  ORF Transcript_25954/g.34770 Transcript_25954/m.34770 type:complete len:102 (-) Transcript_25954:95-400(-)
MDNKVKLTGITVSNSRIDTTFDSYEALSSSFEGWVSKGAVGGDPFGENKDAARCAFTITRHTTDSEKTASDGSLTRIEAGRSLKAIVWDNIGVRHEIEFTL